MLAFLIQKILNLKKQYHDTNDTSEYEFSIHGNCQYENVLIEFYSLKI
jgi:hypothetical protein